MFTKNVSRAIRFAKGLEADQVGVNVTGMSDVNLVFGGWKGSGMGRELDDHGIVQEYTDLFRCTIWAFVQIMILSISSQMPVTLVHPNSIST